MDKFAMDDIDFGLLAGEGIATRAVKAGAVIFQEGDKADGLFIIKSGLVGIRLGNRSLAELNANSIFGEMALIDDAPRSATASFSGEASRGRVNVGNVIAGRKLHLI